MKRTIRTFLAVEIAAAARGRAVELIRGPHRAGADVKWVDAQNLHFTLKFLDEVPLAEIPRSARWWAGRPQRSSRSIPRPAAPGPFPARPGQRLSGWARAGAGEMIALHGAIGKGI